MQWLTENEIAFSIIFTKSDKLKSNNIQDKISSYKEIVERNMGRNAKLFHNLLNKIYW